jgi:hypothetical protein
VQEFMYNLPIVAIGFELGKHGLGKFLLRRLTLIFLLVILMRY